MLRQSRFFFALTKTPLLFGVVFLSGSLLEAEEWDRFRGPNGTGVSNSVVFPEQLNPDEALWRRELPAGFSSPVLGNGCVYVTGGEKTELATYCLDAESGEIPLAIGSTPETKRK